MTLIKFGLSVSARVRGTDGARSQQHATLSALALAAFSRGDSAAYNKALTSLAEMAATSLTTADQKQVHDQEQQILKELPLPIKSWQSLIGKLCWGGATLDPKALLNRVKTATKQRG